MSNSLDTDQAPHFVGPDLGPNCLQRFQQRTKIAASKERVKEPNTYICEFVSSASLLAEATLCCSTSTVICCSSSRDHSWFTMIAELAATVDSISNTYSETQVLCYSFISYNTELYQSYLFNSLPPSVVC